MASVTMNAFRRSLTTRKPLMKPISAPVANRIRMASQTFRPMPEPPNVVSLTISQAASIGGSATVNSSDRSNLPAIRISASAITSTDSSDDCCRMFRKFLVVRKASLIRAPARIAITIAGTRVSSRKRNVEARRRSASPMPAWRDLRRLSRHLPLPRSLPPARDRASPRRTRPPACREKSPGSRSQATSSSRSSETISTAVPAARAFSRIANSAALEAMSTPCIGCSTTSTLGSEASARPITAFC